MIKKMIISIFIFAVLAVSGNTVFGDRLITFGWDANTEADLAGYRLYEKLSDGSYSLVADVSELTHTITVADLVDKAWVLTAYDTSNNESGYSNEVSKDTIPPDAPSVRITIDIIITP